MLENCRVETGDLYDLLFECLVADGVSVDLLEQVRLQIAQADVAQKQSINCRLKSFFHSQCWSSMTATTAQGEMDKTLESSDLTVAKTTTLYAPSRAISAHPLLDTRLGRVLSWYGLYWFAACTSVVVNLFLGIRARMEEQKLETAVSSSGAIDTHLRVHTALAWSRIVATVLLMILLAHRTLWELLRMTLLSFDCLILSSSVISISVVRCNSLFQLIHSTGELSRSWIFALLAGQVSHVALVMVLCCLDAIVLRRAVKGAVICCSICAFAHDYVINRLFAGIWLDGELCSFIFCTTDRSIYLWGLINIIVFLTKFLTSLVTGHYFCTLHAHYAFTAGQDELWNRRSTLCKSSYFRTLRWRCKRPARVKRVNQTGSTRHTDRVVESGDTPTTWSTTWLDCTSDSMLPAVPNPTPNLFGRIKDPQKLHFNVPCADSDDIRLFDEMEAAICILPSTIGQEPVGATLRCIPHGMKRARASGNYNNPDDYMWLMPILRAITTNEASSLGCQDLATGNSLTPIFVALGACPNSFCGMQAVMYSYAESDASVDFWWVKPVKANGAELEANMLCRHNRGPHKNDPGRSKPALQPLADIFQNGSKLGGWNFGIKMVTNEDGDVVPRAVMQKQDESTPLYVYMIWQEDWTSPTNIFAKEKFIKGHIIYQKTLSGETTYYARQYELVMGRTLTLSILDFEEPQLGAELPGKSIKNLWEPE